MDPDVACVTRSVFSIFAHNTQMLLFNRDPSQQRVTVLPDVVMETVQKERMAAFLFKVVSGFFAEGSGFEVPSGIVLSQVTDYGG
jgi:hypothetical protein